ncbi:MAG: radical SAM protein [Candidatus Omnitrophota bacterium]|nr:radical SAM protein [Candidatus Omnitrophota bacterium]
MMKGSPSLKTIFDIVIKRPDRIMPHIKTRLAYSWPLLSRGYANFPHVIYLGITGHCNLSCRMCDLGQKKDTLYRRNLSPKEDLPLRTWKKLIDEVAVFKPIIELCAAEPLLYKDFVSLVRYIKENKRLTCRIFTNGYLLEEYSQLIKETGIDYLFMSLDGPAKIHDFIRGQDGLFDKVMRGLHKLRNQTTGKNTAIDINFCISEYNYDRITDTFNILRELDVPFDRFTVMNTLFTTREMADRHIRLFPSFPAGGICEDCVNFNAINPSVIKEQMLELIQKHPEKIRFYPDFNLNQISDWYRKPDKPLGNKGCLFIWNSAAITSDGNIIANLRCVNKSFGNIRESSFMKVWNGDLFRRFRLLSRRTGMFPICTRCSASFMK